MSEYNELTKRLLSEGYTIENYPKYVQLPGGVYGKDPLQNIYGGFEYKRWYCTDIVYKTGCGKFVMGNSVIGNMGYMSVEWTHENGNPVIRCPFNKSECELNNPLLHGTVGGGLSIQCWCECHVTDEEYCYEKSIEKLNKDRDEEKDRKYKEYADAHNGRICSNHMYYDERTGDWVQRYKPDICSKRCHSIFCPILGHELDRKRGNVFYDLKTGGIRHDGTLFDGDEWSHVEKGIRFFDNPVSMDICEAFVKNQSDEIYRKYKWNTLTTMQMLDKTYYAEILNIRAESRPSRDLMQDLEDIKNGASITHASDNEKRKKENKKIRRNELKEKKIQKLEKKILDIGYENIEEYSLDRVHVDKWIPKERIIELTLKREKISKDKLEQPVQMELSEFFSLK